MQIQELYTLYLKHPNICTDTRKPIDKSIFFALKGKEFNGNKFAQKAIREGCSFAIVDEKKYASNEKLIVVENVLETLQELAKYHRNKLSLPIIGITGTNGKTTSKEIINAILSSQKCCYATKGNLNNHIGVPLSILEINQKHEIAIIEMGANHIHEISFLCDIAKPNFGVITNIGKAHLEGFGSIEGVIKAKSELYQFIKKQNGKIFVNNEIELLLKLGKDIKKSTYGKEGDYKGVTTANTPFISVQFRSNNIVSNLIGDYQFYNIMLAIAIGKDFGITDKNIKLAIENYTPKNNRSEVFTTKNNTLILDAYNANPSSMNAMLYSFAKQNYENKLCILGDMLEMGEASLKEHQAIIDLATELKLESIFIGEEFSKVNDNAYKSIEDFSQYLRNNRTNNRTILLKGSRGIALEKLIDLL